MDSQAQDGSWQAYGASCGFVLRFGSKMSPGINPPSPPKRPLNPPNPQRMNLQKRKPRNQALTLRLRSVQRRRE